MGTVVVKEVKIADTEGWKFFDGKGVNGENITFGVGPNKTSVLSNGRRVVRGYPGTLNTTSVKWPILVEVIRR